MTWKSMTHHHTSVQFQRPSSKNQVWKLRSRIVPYSSVFTFQDYFKLIDAHILNGSKLGCVQNSGLQDKNQISLFPTYSYFQKAFNTLF